MTVTNDVMTGALKGAAMGISGGVLEAITEGVSSASESVGESYGDVAESLHGAVETVGHVVGDERNRGKILAILVVLGVSTTAFILWRSRKQKSTEPAPLSSVQ